jgi:hypothetical protein
MEEWRSIKRFPAYQASSFGRIRRAAPDRRGLGVGTVLAPRLGRAGYLLIGLLGPDHRQVTVTVHSVIADTFLGPRPSPAHEVAHNDGSRTNNAAGNLRWATRSENFADKHAHGTAATGERNPASKLTEADVREVRRLRDLGNSLRSIADRFGVSRVAVRHIVNRSTWSHVQ